MHTFGITVSVIIPMRNEEHRIRRCLDSILANDFPHNLLEILVVDGMSTDRSRAIVAERASHFPFIHILANERKIVSCGLNIGIRQARGQVIIVMGAHAEYPRSYIDNCIAELERTGADVVGGVLETRPGADTLIARAVALMSQHPFGVGRSAFRTREAEGYVDTVPYGAYRREVFEDVGLFNEQLVRNQDFELNARVRKAGGRLFLSRALEVVYYNVPDFRRLAKQAFRNGFWLAEMWWVSPLSFRMRHAIPLIFVLVLLVSGILAPFSAWASGIAGVTMAIYGLAAAVAATQIAVRAGVQFFFPLIASFFVHHFLYGLGTFAGVPSGLRLSLRQHKARLTEAASG